jgi:hypothetical protein
MQLSTTPYNEKLIHCNPKISSYVNEDQITHREDPTSIGPRHNPASFEKLISDTAYNLSQHGWKITEKCVVLSHPGDKLFFAFLIQDTMNPMPPEYYSLMVIGRASHDQSWSFQLDGGDYVYLCDNKVMAGQLGRSATKQTTFLADRQWDFINQSVAKLAPFAAEKAAQYKALTETPIADSTAHDLFVKVLQKRGLTSAQLEASVKEFHNPLMDSPMIIADKFSTSGELVKNQREEDIWEVVHEPSRVNTAWGAWNAMTSSIKGSSEAILKQRSKIITAVTNEYFEIA